MANEKEMVVKEFSADIIKDIKGFEDEFRIVFSNIKGFEQVICSTPKMKKLIKASNDEKDPLGYTMDNDGNNIKLNSSLLTAISASLSIAEDYLIGCYDVEEFKIRLAEVLELNPEDIDISDDGNGKKVKIVNKGDNLSKDFTVESIRNIQAFALRFKKVFDKMSGFEKIICSTPKFKTLINENNLGDNTSNCIDDDGNSIKLTYELRLALFAVFIIADEFIQEKIGLLEFEEKLGDALKIDSDRIRVAYIASGEGVKYAVKIGKDVNKFIDTDSFVNIADDIRAIVLARVNDKFKDINVITIIEGLQKASLFHLVEFNDKNNYVLASCEALSNGSKVQLIFTDTDTVLKYKI